MSKKLAVLVGINYLNDPSVRLYGCINDIDNMANVLIKNFGYDPANILKLRDDQSNTALLPTRSNIVLALKNLIAQSATCSEIWFHYSGHGAQTCDLDRDEYDGLDEVIVPLDFKTAGLVTDDEIFNMVKLSKCKTMLIFDSCHSGSVCDLQWGFEYKNGNYIKTQASRKAITNPNVISISGCKDSQTSADAFSSTLNQNVGAFTSTFIQCLTNNGFSGNILKIYSDVIGMIGTSGFTQIPILSCSSVVPMYTFSNVGPALIPKVNATTVTTTTTGTPAKKDIDIQISASLTPGENIFSFGMNIKGKRRGRMQMHF